jgi:predicted adenylyl cyclase CyaB
MPRNVEIKAAIGSVETLAPAVAAISSEGPLEIEQDDTFFHCDAGRLKLRTFSESSGELIFYRRPDTAGPKESFYLRSPTQNPASLREALSQAYGVVGRVVKRRTLFLAGRTRVHLDRVTGLGDFLELEVVLGDAEPAEAGLREARDLLARLGIRESQLVEGAYIDHLLRKGG